MKFFGRWGESFSERLTSLSCDFTLIWSDSPADWRGVTPPPLTWTTQQRWSSGGAESELQPDLDWDGHENQNTSESQTFYTRNKTPLYSLLCSNLLVPPCSSWFLLSAVDVPFSRWSKDDVCGWLHEQGLGLYVSQGQSWIKSGQTLLQASQHDLEKVKRKQILTFSCFDFSAGRSLSF